MQFRKKEKTLQENLNNRKIIFFIGPRQVGKTTILKKIFGDLETDKKLFLNLEILDYHEYFQSFDKIKELLFKNGFKNGNNENIKDEKFYLFLDEFHKVKNISWILKSLYDEFDNLKIIITGSNNIEINKNISESFAGRKRVVNCYPLDFEEFIIWKEKILENSVKNFIENPLNKAKINLYLEEFISYGGYPEVVKTENKLEKKQIFEDIFSFWFNKDILPEIKKDYKFNQFLKHLAVRNGELLNLNKIAQDVGVGQPTIEKYFYLLQESLLVYPVRPFFSNKLKEIVKMPKFYFGDIGFRNFLINRFDFLENEKGLLFENFIFSEFLKSGIFYENIKFWRLKTGTNEVDFILEDEKKAFEVKYRDEEKKEDFKGLKKFLEVYKNFFGKVLNKKNFFNF